MIAFSPQINFFGKKADNTLVEPASGKGGDPRR
jgi:hypothetical protein